MCIKPPLPGQVLKDIILIYKPSLEETLGRPIGLMLIGCGMFPGDVITEISSAHGYKNSASSNSNEVIHGPELILTAFKKVKNYTK
jgi:hypothetical protein